MEYIYDAKQLIYDSTRSVKFECMNLAGLLTSLLGVSILVSINNTFVAIVVLFIRTCS